MIKNIKNKIRKRKVRRLLEFLWAKGTFDKDYDGIPRKDEERTVLGGVNVFYHDGARTEDDFVEMMEDTYEQLHMPFYLEKESLKRYRRASTWFLQSDGFRERILHFYLDYLLPFAERKSFFEICKLCKKVNKKYKK